MWYNHLPKKLYSINDILINILYPNKQLMKKYSAQ